MLVTLILSQHQLQHLARGAYPESLKNDLERLLDTLMSDYGKRLEREQLQLDDIEMHLPINSGALYIPMSCKLFRVRNTVFRVEQNWTILHFMALLISLLDSGAQHSREIVVEDETEGQNKRRKIMHRLDDLISQVRGHDVGFKLMSLQIFSFLIEYKPFSASDLEFILDILMGLMSDKDGIISSWAMIAVARYYLLKEFFGLS